jgi:hypothetical protein
MSNVNGKRTGLKPCEHCGSKNRDSNGQCRCRNTLYRALKDAPAATKQKATKHFNAALKTAKGDAAKALASTREEFPSLAPKRKAPADRKSPAKKTAAKKATPAKKTAAKKATPAKKAATPKKGKAADEAADAIVEETRKAVAPSVGKYVLEIKDGFTDPKGYARKDAAVKNGVRSNEEWTVTLNGKIVAQSDDLL